MRTHNVRCTTESTTMTHMNKELMTYSWTTA